MEDITVVGLTMRDIRNAPILLRLGAPMRGPTELSIGTLKRVPAYTRALDVAELQVQIDEIRQNLAQLHEKQLEET